MHFRGLILLAAICAPIPAFAQTPMRLTLDTPQTGSLDASDLTDEYGSPGETWVFNAAPETVYTVTLQSTQFDAVLAVDVGSAARAPASVFDDNSKPGLGHNDSIATFSTTSATTVRIRAGTVQRGANGAYTIKIVSSGTCAEIDKTMDVGFIYGCPQKPPATPADIERERQAAIAEIRAQADAGKPAGYFGLAMMAYSEHRLADAALLFDKAYTAGRAGDLPKLPTERAGFTLAELHSRDDVSFPGHDPARAVQIWNELAGQGSVEALEKLAWAYRFGKAGLSPSQPAALDYYSRAALAGSAKSALLLAQLYDGSNDAGNGQRESDYVQRVRAQQAAKALSVPPDPAVATRWWGVAAQLRDRAAMLEYSRRLEAGIGIAANHTEALRWLRKAAVAKHPAAITQLQAAVAAGQFR